ncbi:V-type ATP synthase subunit D [Fundicoccus culcitae]|uniref:V-type ATP synthase subunit D n=1 Tax=Fundicoccus culcitae TaxID=2969821 RepID=A0ABY5P5E3_9LACT|nr:V-type ATP synthase subunit D [Fundicoccus culcitae]UUX33648.1 V-type ATP synthase subunit D [Fundicoccus culcitae]
MAVLNVKPTRMELARLKSQLKLSVRGHKLLKDKQDGLMKEFIIKVKQTNALRSEVIGELGNAMQHFAVAKSLVDEKFIEEIMAIPAQSVSLDIDYRNILSIKVPKMYFNYNQAPKGKVDLSYSYLNTNAELDIAFEGLIDIMPKLLEFAELEKTCQLMAVEIERTRRRVNALEYRTIPDLQDTIYFIRMKLEENARATTSRLIKIKEMEG